MWTPPSGGGGGGGGGGGFGEVFCIFGCWRFGKQQGEAATCQKKYTQKLIWVFPKIGVPSNHEFS